MPETSIITGVYNIENCQSLHKSMQSILRQTYSDFEWILCDDGSTDSTWELLQEYASQDKRIRLLRNEKNMGLAATLNYCLNYAKGEFVAFVDSDDWIEPETYKTALEYADRYSAAHIVWSYVSEYGDNIKEKKLAAMREIPSPAQVAVNIPLSQFSVFRAYNKKIDVYDLRTLKHLFAIPECPDLYVTNCSFSPSGNVMLQGGFGDDRKEICLFVARNNRWEFAGRIFGVSTKEYFILDPNFYSDQIILFLLSNPNRSTPKQLCFFDLREKKIVKK